MPASQLVASSQSADRKVSGIDSGLLGSGMYTSLGMGPKVDIHRRNKKGMERAGEVGGNSREELTELPASWLVTQQVAGQSVSK